MDSDDQCGIETQVAGVVAGAAKPLMKSKAEVPRPTQSIDQRHRETPIRPVDARPAIASLKPKAWVPGTSKRKRNGHPRDETHAPDAVAGRTNERVKSNVVVSGHPSSNGQTNVETHIPSAVASHDPAVAETHRRLVMAGHDRHGHKTPLMPVVATIRELWRRRQEQHRAEKSLTLQAGAICRRYVGGDKEAAQKLLKSVEDGKDNGPAMVATATILQARSVLEAERKALEKQLSKLATELPVAPWVDGVRGFAILSLAAIVGEAGDLSNYATVSKLWKRMGLAVINGERQRKVAGVDALEHGYAPHRRSLMWVIADNMIRATKPGGNELYRAFYEAEKAKQLAKGISLGHANNRAKRHMTKLLLANLWAAWGAASDGLKPKVDLPRLANPQ